MIHVMIERIIADGLSDYYNNAIKRTIHAATHAPGCLSGESLVDTDNNNRRIVLSTWRSKYDWDNWYHSEARQEALNDVRPLLEHDEKVTILASSFN